MAMRLEEDCKSYPLPASRLSIWGSREKSRESSTLLTVARAFSRGLLRSPYMESLLTG